MGGTDFANRLAEYASSDQGWPEVFLCQPSDFESATESRMAEHKVARPGERTSLAVRAEEGNSSWTRFDNSPATPFRHARPLANEARRITSCCDPKERDSQVCSLFPANRRFSRVAAESVGLRLRPSAWSL